MFKFIVGLMTALGLVPCLAAPVGSGNYAGLLIGVDRNGLLTGYFESSTGRGQFSCIFFVSGKLNESSSRVDTWFPGERDPKEVIRGTLEQTSQDSMPTIRLQLEDEHGGCGNVQRFASDPASFRLTEQGSWETIRIVSSKKAYFYDEPSSAKPRKAYVVTGNPLRVFETREGWARVEYVSPGKQRTRGWVSERDLFSPKSPAAEK